MQGSEATIIEIPSERERSPGGRGAVPLILGAVVAATAGCLAAYAIHARHAEAPASVVKAAPVPVAAQPAREDPATLFGAIIVEPEWRDQMAQAAPPAQTTVASLGPDAAPPPAALAPAPALPSGPQAPAAAKLSLDSVPLPPVRDVPRVDNSVPLPPARPAELAEPSSPPSAPAIERRVAEPASPAGPVDNRTVLQKLLGIGQQPGAVASLPPPPPAAPPRPASEPATPAPPAPPATTVVARPPAPGGGRSGLFRTVRQLSPVPSPDRFGYDRQTAIYDISARAVYLPDGTKLEAHSGLGRALDDVRYVSARAIGPTPPHLYELTMRESPFHGVQALRLNPVGEGGLYGRAGLLAHPYMLGPNGDSNGCVSVKDYEAFLRAYQNGQIRKLAVVARL